ncbi:MAG: hypothetical protein U1F41_16150 [Burkholderiales bacterium]
MATFGTLLVGGCISVPLLEEASLRVMHERARQDPRAQAIVEQRLATATCFQLREWERAVRDALETAESRGSIATLSLDVLRSDQVRLHDAVAARQCPPLDVLLEPGAAQALPGKVEFRCACWVPRDLYPFGSLGQGPAGRDCVTVRLELVQGNLTIHEASPDWGDGRHDLTAQSPVYSTLGYEDRRKLISGGYPPDAGWSGTQSDGWLDTPLGNLRLLADDCTPLPPEQAGVAEKTVLRGLQPPAR